MGVSLLFSPCNSSALWAWKKSSSFSLNINSNKYPSIYNSDRRVVKTLCFDINQVPILEKAVKEPVAFMGGMFAGLLRLDLNEDPLKEWVTKTVEASGIREDDISEKGIQEKEDTPQQIKIE